MANYDDIVGWFYRNGKRIPIKSKKGEKAEKKYITKKAGVTPDYSYYSTDYDTPGGHVHKDHDTIDEARDFLRRNGVTKREEFKGITKREPDKGMLRKNAKQRGATKAPRRSEGKAFGVPRQHSKSFLSESRARRHESYLHTQGAKNVQVTGSKDAFGQTQHRVEWDEPKRKKK